MDNNIVYTEEYKSMRIEIHADTDGIVDSPRDWDNLGIMICFHRRYKMGDSHKYRDADNFFESVARELDETRYNRLESARQNGAISDDDYNAAMRDIFNAGTVALPVFLYEHSGLSMSTSAQDFAKWDSMGWEWGQEGIIYMTRARAVQAFGNKRFTKQVKARALQCLRTEVNVYDDYLCGNVYGFVVSGIGGEHLDSCWGFIGDYRESGGCLAQARDAADYHAADVAAELSAIADTTYTIA